MPCRARLQPARTRSRSSGPTTRRTRRPALPKQLHSRSSGKRRLKSGPGAAAPLRGHYNGHMPPAGDVTHEWTPATQSRACGAGVARRAQRISFRVWTVLLPALVVFAAEVLRHEVLPEYLHDALPEM